MTIPDRSSRQDLQEWQIESEERIMKSPRTDIHHLANRTKKNLSQTARKSRASGRRRTTGLTRICALIVFAALAATALSVPSFHSLSSRSLSNAASAAAAPESWKETLAAANHAGLGGNSFSAERTGESAFWSHAAAIFPLAPVQAASPATAVTIAALADDINDRRDGWTATDGGRPAPGNTQDR